MKFDGPIPQGIRRGQTLQIRLALSDEITALLLPKVDSISKLAAIGYLK
jgi:HlyD family secretion protein